MVSDGAVGARDPSRHIGDVAQVVSTRGGLDIVESGDHRPVEWPIRVHPGEATTDLVAIADTS